MIKEIENIQNDISKGYNQTNFFPFESCIKIYFYLKIYVYSNFFYLTNNYL